MMKTCFYVLVYLKYCYIVDPANDNMEYKPIIDISELIKHKEVMETYKLGPNGALIYCMEFLEKNIDWLIKKISNLIDQYLLIDCPGQVIFIK
jgi:hypothetical protein